MEDEEYELVPHEALARIKRELEGLKEKASTKKTIPKDFKSSMDKLSQNINNLMGLFKEAAESMKKEELEVEPALKEQLAPFLKRIDTIESENKTIAQGILVLADMIKEFKVEEKKVEKGIDELKKIPKRMPPPMPPPRPVQPIRPMPRAPPQMAQPRTPPQMAQPRTPPQMAQPRAPPQMAPPAPFPRAAHFPGKPPQMAPPFPERPGTPIPPPGPFPPSHLPEIKPQKKGIFSGLFKKK